MSEWQQIPMATKTGRVRSGAVSLERLVNLYAVPNPPGSPRPFTLYGTPGLLLWATVGDGPIRGAYRFRGDVFVVSGAELYAVDIASKSETLLGPIAGNGAVRMTDNGIHVAIATSSKLYAANRSTLLELPESNMATVAAQDGYVIFTRRGTQDFYIAGPDDLTTINPLDFSTADAFPDNLIGGISDHRELVLIGEETIEGWANTGNAGFPFERIPGAFIEHGGISPGSIAKADNRVYWLGDDLRVYRAAGYQPEPISDPGIEALIADASGPESSEAFTYTQAGHTFYVLSFGDLTLAFDTVTGLWHERKSYGIDRWRVSCHVRASATLHLVGDYENGKLYSLDLDTFDENGAVLEREMVDPPFEMDGRNIFMAARRLETQAGVGLGTGQGDDPQAMLDWTDDNGHTWVGGMQAGIGEIGEYRRAAEFHRLGMFTNRSYRTRITDPVRVVIRGQEARYEVSA